VIREKTEIAKVKFETPNGREGLISISSLEVSFRDGETTELFGIWGTDGNGNAFSSTASTKENLEAYLAGMETMRRFICYSKADPSKIKVPNLPSL
jgi:hypothetical protein